MTLITESLKEKVERHGKTRSALLPVLQDIIAEKNYLFGYGSG